MYTLNNYELIINFQERRVHPRKEYPCRNPFTIF